MIRQAEETDLHEILTIYNDAIVNTTAVYFYAPHTLEDRKVWFADKVKYGHPVIVFEENGSVVGFATYGQFRAFPAYKYTVENSVYVDERFRGKGVGRKLLEEIIKLAESREVATMVAVIDSENYVSINLHKRLGYYYGGKIKRVGYKFGKWLDLVFYQIDLKGPVRPTEN